jgi:hypothetical protein
MFQRSLFASAYCTLFPLRILFMLSMSPFVLRFSVRECSYIFADCWLGEIKMNFHFVRNASELFFVSISWSLLYWTGLNWSGLDDGWMCSVQWAMCNELFFPLKPDPITGPLSHWTTFLFREHSDVPWWLCSVQWTMSNELFSLWRFLWLVQIVRLIFHIYFSYIAFWTLIIIWIGIKLTSLFHQITFSWTRFFVPKILLYFNSLQVGWRLKVEGYLDSWLDSNLFSTKNFQNRTTFDRFRTVFHSNSPFTRV